MDSLIIFITYSLLYTVFMIFTEELCFYAKISNNISLVRNCSLSKNIVFLKKLRCILVTFGQGEISVGELGKLQVTVWPEVFGAYWISNSFWGFCFCVAVNVVFIVLFWLFFFFVLFWFFIPIRTIAICRSVSGTPTHI